MEENKRKQEGLDPREREQILPDDQGCKIDKTFIRWDAREMAERGFGGS